MAATARWEDILEAVGMTPRPTPNPRWSAVAGAVILGLLVVIGLLSTRLHLPAATPAAPPVADYGPPPAGVPLLYVKDPNHPSWLIGFDWSGKPRATVKLDPAIDSVGMAPNGQSFAVGFGAKGGTGELLDRLGQPVRGASGAIPGSALPIWADDYQHTCGVSFDQQTFVSTLVTLAPGQAVKAVAELGKDQSLPNTFRIASCSFRNDQAIVVRSNAQGEPSELLAVRLSNGQLISHYALDSPELLSNVVASPDSTLVAENSSKSEVEGPFTAPTTIRRVSDWAVVDTAQAGIVVLAFNSDDSLLLFGIRPLTGGQPTTLSISDLASGQELWSYGGPGIFGNAIGQPGGKDFAIYVRKRDGDDPLADLMIVHAEGYVTDFPRRYQPAW
jgi:hypothetical protein